MFKLPIFGKKKLLLAFEAGLLIDQVAKQQGREVTKELVERTEKIILQEFSENSAERIAINMVPIILSSFETN